MLDQASETAVLSLLKWQEQGLIMWPMDLELQLPSAVEGAESLAAWLGREVRWQGGDQLIQFGRDGTGSLYCLWSYSDLKGPPPVVFLGSEGELDHVAESAEHFVRYLGAGFDFGFGGWYVIGNLTPAEAQRRRQLQAEIEPCYGRLEVQPDQLDQQQLAGPHPCFASWVEAVKATSL